MNVFQEAHRLEEENEEEQLIQELREGPDPELEVRNLPQIPQADQENLQRKLEFFFQQ